MNDDSPVTTTTAELQDSHHPELVRADMREFIDWLKMMRSLLSVKP